MSKSFNAVCLGMAWLLLFGQAGLDEAVAVSRAKPDCVLALNRTAGDAPVEFKPKIHRVVYLRGGTPDNPSEKVLGHYVSVEDSATRVLTLGSLPEARDSTALDARALRIYSARTGKLIRVLETPRLLNSDPYFFSHRGSDYAALKGQQGQVLVINLTYGKVIRKLTPGGLDSSRWVRWIQMNGRNYMLTGSDSLFPLPAMLSYVLTDLITGKIVRSFSEAVSQNRVQTFIEYRNRGVYLIHTQASVESESYLKVVYDLGTGKRLGASREPGMPIGQFHFGGGKSVLAIGRWKRYLGDEVGEYVGSPGFASSRVDLLRRIEFSDAVSGENWGAIDAGDRRFQFLDAYEDLRGRRFGVIQHFDPQARVAGDLAMVDLQTGVQRTVAAFSKGYWFKRLRVAPELSRGEAVVAEFTGTHPDETDTLKRQIQTFSSRGLVDLNTGAVFAHPPLGTQILESQEKFGSGVLLSAVGSGDTADQVSFLSVDSASAPFALWQNIRIPYGIYDAPVVYAPFFEKGRWYSLVTTPNSVGGETAFVVVDLGATR